MIKIKSKQIITKHTKIYFRKSRNASDWPMQNNIPPRMTKHLTEPMILKSLTIANDKTPHFTVFFFTTMRTIFCFHTQPVDHLNWYWDEFFVCSHVIWQRTIIGIHISRSDTMFNLLVKIVAVSVKLSLSVNIFHYKYIESRRALLDFCNFLTLFSRLFICACCTRSKTACTQIEGETKDSSTSVVRPLTSIVLPLSTYTSTIFYK